MKITILSDTFDNSNGPARVAHLMAEAFQKLDHEVNIIASTQDRSKAGKKILDGMTVWFIYSDYNLFWRPYISLYNLQTIGAVRKILNEIQPDVVHTHNIHIYLSYHALKIAKQAGARVFLTAHDAMLFHYGKLTEFMNPNNLRCPEKFNYKISIWQQIKKAGKTYNPFRNIIICHYLKYIDKIFAVSGALKDALNQNGIKNIEVIHNGINTDEWTVGANLVNDFKDKYNLNDKKIVLFGGRLAELKGGKQIVSVVSEVIKEVKNAALVVIGNKDNYANSMMDLAVLNGLEKNIIFTGWLSGEDLKAAFNAANIAVTPSVCFDSFPTVNLEAMACKKPVIATCFGGSREIVLDGKTGYIVNPFDTKTMAEKIIDLLKNTEKAHQFGQAGYERVKKEFSLEKQAEETMKWYQSVLSHKNKESLHL